MVVRSQLLKWPSPSPEPTAGEGVKASGWPSPSPGLTVRSHPSQPFLNPLCLPFTLLPLCRRLNIAHTPSGHAWASIALARRTQPVDLPAPRLDLLAGRQHAGRSSIAGRAQGARRTIQAEPDPDDAASDPGADADAKAHRHADNEADRDAATEGDEHLGHEDGPPDGDADSPSDVTPSPLRRPRG